jgi:hypothetical protein
MLYPVGSVAVSAAPFVVTIFAAFAACVLILALAALMDSDAETVWVRAAQKLRLGRSRMGRMLRRRHVALSSYARSLSVVEIKRQLGTCRNCRLTDLCDRALDARGPSRSSFSFCPNRADIERYLAGATPAFARIR